MSNQIPNKIQNHCRVTIEVPTGDEIVEALKWINVAKLDELDFDFAIKIEYIKISRCSDTECDRVFDDFDVARIYGAIIAKFIDRDDIDKRTYSVKLIVIPKKFADAFIELKHRNEYGVHYHAIYRTGVIDNTVNGWKERIVYREDP
jgi:hypothetical protein